MTMSKKSMSPLGERTIAFVLLYKDNSFPKTQSAGAVAYVVCISAEG